MLKCFLGGDDFFPFFPPKLSRFLSMIERKEEKITEKKSYDDDDNGLGCFAAFLMMFANVYLSCCIHTYIYNIKCPIYLCMITFRSPLYKSLVRDSVIINWAYMLWLKRVLFFRTKKGGSCGFFSLLLRGLQFLMICGQLVK